MKHKLTPAIKVENDIFTGYSHSQAISRVPRGVDIEKRKDGFVNDCGHFFTRSEAFDYAERHGLLKDIYADGNWKMLNSYMLA